jgi:hypothetical protein
MDNIIASCSAHVSYLYNSKVNALLPMIHAEVEVVKGRGNQPTETLNFCATPAGMNQLMASIQDAIQTTEMAKNSKPQFMTEGEWFQFLKNHPEDAVINGDDQPPVEG